MTDQTTPPETSSADQPSQTNESDIVDIWCLRALLFDEKTSRRYLSTMHYGTDPIEDLALGEKLSSLDLSDGDETQTRLKDALLEAMNQLGPSERITIQNVELLSRALELGDAAKHLLALALLMETEEPIRSLFEALLSPARGKPVRLLQALASVFHIAPQELHEALSPQGLLTQCGLLKFTPSNHMQNMGLFEVPDMLLGQLSTPAKNGHALLERLVAKAPPNTLKYKDFNYIGSDIGLAILYLGHALYEQEDGVGFNILIHGPTGVGKTEFSRALAAELNSSVYEVGFTDADGDALGAQERMASFRLSQEILSRSMQPALLVFDELEDVFPTFTGPRMMGMPPFNMSRSDKAWTNRILEEVKVPTIWISNSITQLDPALVRRFDLVMPIGTPPLEVRQKILKRALKGTGIRRPFIESLARDERITAADAQRTAKVVKAIAPGRPTIAEKIAAQSLMRHLELRPGTSDEKPFDRESYDPSLIHSSIDPDVLARRLGLQGHGRVCFFGPPGTGKTSYARFVADSLGMKIITMRASDVLSKWVGESEQNIKNLFQRATVENAVILIDEVEGLLRNKTSEMRGWEITQTNELLSAIEDFDGILFASSNSISMLEGAGFRRFDVVVEFKRLPKDALITQLTRLCKKVLSKKAQPSASTLQRAVAGLPDLSAGDLESVARRVRLVYDNPDFKDVVACLNEYHTTQNRGRSRPSVGFRGRTLH